LSSGSSWTRTARLKTKTQIAAYPKRTTFPKSSACPTMIDVRPRIRGRRSGAWSPPAGTAGGSLAEDGGSQELAALVEHALFDDLVRPPLNADGSEGRVSRSRDCERRAPCAKWRLSGGQHNPTSDGLPWTPAFAGVDRLMSRPSGGLCTSVSED